MAYPMYEVDWSVLPPEQNRRQVKTEIIPNEIVDINVTITLIITFITMFPKNHVG